MNVMALEQILHEMENNSPTRDPAKYHFFIFGKPANKELGGESGRASPLAQLYDRRRRTRLLDTGLLRSESGTRKTGAIQRPTSPSSGRRLWPTARENAVSRTKGKAIIAEDAPDDVINGPGRDASPLEPAGLAAKDMNEKQQRLLMRLLKTYVNKARQPLAKADMKKIEDAGIENITLRGPES